jgi:hypothetical protein
LQTAAASLGVTVGSAAGGRSSSMSPPCRVILLKNRKKEEKDYETPQNASVVPQHEIIVHLGFYYHGPINDGHNFCASE